jgi:hypothetical protein
MGTLKVKKIWTPICPPLASKLGRQLCCSIHQLNFPSQIYLKNRILDEKQHYLLLKEMSWRNTFA